MKKIIGFCLLVLICGFGDRSEAQPADSLRLSLQGLDSLFLVQNYSLLAQQYQVKSDQALIQQSRLWDNPNFSAEFGMNSINHPKWPLGGTPTEMIYSVSQAFKIAGQRNKAVRLAQLNADYSQAAFFDLMRTLRLQLHIDFYTLYFKERTLGVLKEQESILSNIVKAYQQADEKGSVAHADFIRLSALHLSLKNDYLQAQNEIFEVQQELQQLLGTTAIITPLVTGNAGQPFDLDQYSVGGLVDTAMANRADQRMAELNVQSAQANYNLQKSLAVPDVNLGLNYDKAGGVVPNYWGLTLGVDLPFWNRNQGNIHASKFQIDAAREQLNAQNNRVETEVFAAYKKAIGYRDGFKQPDLQGFEHSFKTLIDQVALNFKKGNISLLQFIDFFNSYSDNVSDLNGYYLSLYSAYEQLEFAVGKNLK